MPGSGPARWGWHRLDSRVAERIVAAAGIRPGDLVLDVGAGHGALTAPLLDAGARVIAFEVHPGRAAALRRRFEGRAARVVMADAVDLRLPRRPFKVVANPPFFVLPAILRRLLSPGSRLERADLVAPRFVATKWASPGAPGAGRWGTTFQAQRGPTIPQRAFHDPAPEPVCLLVIRRLDAPNAERRGRSRVGEGPRASQNSAGLPSRHGRL